MAVTSFELRSHVRGYHVYRLGWSPVVGDELRLNHEVNNEYDRFAVAIMRNDQVAGHVPIVNQQGFLLFFNETRAQWHL